MYWTAGAYSHTDGESMWCERVMEASESKRRKSCHRKNRQNATRIQEQAGTNRQKVGEKLEVFFTELVSKRTESRKSFMLQIKS